MRAARLWAPVIMLAAAGITGRWLAAPDPSQMLYLYWLVAAGAASGIVTGIWAGKVSTTLTTGFLLGAALMLPQLLIYRLLLPDALMVPPGQVPQDNFAPWLLAGICGLPLAALTGAVSNLVWRRHSC